MMRAYVVVLGFLVFAAATWAKKTTTPKATTAPPTVTTSKSEQVEALECCSDDGDLADQLAKLRYPTEYKPGETYYYYYNAQVLSGVPATASQYSGYKLLARVRLHMRRNRRVHMFFDRIQMLQTNRILPVDRPVHILPRRYFKAIDKPAIYKMIISKLRLGISFIWSRQGHVKSIYTHNADEFWSVNMKKAVMSALNVNMRFSAKQVFMRNGVYKQTPYYEDGIDGQCKASYDYKRFPYTVLGQSRRDNLMTMIKNRHLLNCTRQPSMQHRLFLSEECEESRKPVAAQTETRYNMTKSGLRFFLRQIRTLSKYSYSPESARNGSIETFVVQQLYYLSMRKGDYDKLKESDSRVHRRGLMMVLPLQETKANKQSSRVLRMKMKLILRDLEKMYKAGDMKMHDRMRQFIETARIMSTADIKKVVERALREQEGNSHTREMVLEILSKTATNQVIKVIKLWILEKKTLKDEELAMLVSRLGGMSFVSHDIMVTKLMELVKLMKSPGQSATYKALLLTIGQLIHTRYTRKAPKYASVHVILTPAYIRQFYEQVINQPTAVVPRDVRMMHALQSLGNCGLEDPCLDLIEEQMKPEAKLKPRLRADAIYALFRVAGKAPHRVRKLVMPIFHDYREDVEQRLGAFMTFMSTQPGRDDIQEITTALIREPIKQVRSFVVTYLKSLAEQGLSRCVDGLSRNVSRVLDELPKEWLGAQYSSVLQIPSLRYQNELYSIIFSMPESFLPRVASVRLFSQILGVSFEVGWLGINFENTQQLLNKVFGPDGTARKGKIEDLLTPLRKKGLLDIDYVTFIRLYESIYSIGGISREATAALRKGMIPLSKSVYDLVKKGGQRQTEKQYSMFQDDISLIPTTFGLPFAANNTITAHFKINAQLRLQRSLFKKINTAQVKVQYRASFRHQLRAGVDMTLLRAYVDAESQVEVPKSEKTVITAVWDTRDRSPGVDRSKFRINVKLQSAKRRRVITSSSSLRSALMTTWKALPKIDEKSIAHRSLPRARTHKNTVLRFPELGIELQAVRHIVNSTGLNALPKQPFYGPRRCSLILNRDTSIQGSATIFGKLSVQQRSLREALERIRWPEAKANCPEGIDQEEQTEVEEQNKKMRQMRLYMSLGLISKAAHQVDEVKVGEDEEGYKKIATAKLEYAIIRPYRGIVYHADFRKLRGDKFWYAIRGLVLANKKMMNARFDSKNPLRLEDGAKIVSLISLYDKKRHIFHVYRLGEMGASWKRTIQRIKMDPRKELVTFPDLQRCQIDIQRRRPYTPACYQAWENINAIGYEQTFIFVSSKAPTFIRRVPLVVHNVMRKLYGPALVQSNITRTNVGSIELAIIKAQLSPYDQRTASMYASAVNIWDRYVNARFLISRRNTITKRHSQNAVSNVFEGLYPAKCTAVRKGSRISVRTFDRQDINTLSKLGRQGGRTILVQDIDNRLLVAEQQARNHRAIYIRLNKISQHVMVVIPERAPAVPYAYYKGEPRKLPFILRNKENQVVLVATRERTPYSRASITVYLPLIGSEIRSNPLVATEIYLDPFFHTNVRGICGDFDGELYDEYKSPKCRKVFRYSRTLVDTYTSVLAKKPTVKELESDPKMNGFIDTKQCPNWRYYPIIRYR